MECSAIIFNILNLFIIHNSYYPNPWQAMSTQSDFAELLQKSEQLNLKYKTKIIELQNELNHQRSKARQYQLKFKDAVLQSQFSEGQGLLQKLESKEKELFDCRKQVIELNRRLANTANSPTQNDLMALAHQNEELMANIEEIKSAAINAIMMKEEQIEQLNKNIANYQHLQSQLKFQYEKYESLERQFEICMNEKGEEIRELTEKLSRQREVFLNKLEIIQKESFQEQNYKASLQEKTQDLEGTIEKSQMLIADYQNKIYELQIQISQQKKANQQEKARIEIQFEELKEQIQNYERQEKFMHKTVEELKNKQKNLGQTIAKLNEKNEELSHKLTLKKKKENKVIKDKITSSFAGVAKGNPVYASFAFRAKDSIVQQEEYPKHLGAFPQLQDVEGFIQNFNFDDLGKGKAEQIPNDAPISYIMTKKKPMSKPQTKTEPIQTQPHKNQQNQAPISNVPQPSNVQILKEIQNYKQTLLRVQAQKKQLQISLKDAYNQMQGLNQTIHNMSVELQQQRKNIAELRQQMKKTKKQAELLVEVQSLTLHVEKLQMDMIASKLKYAEEADFAREKQNRERVMWTQKLVQLTEQIAKQDLKASPKPQEKKKKKGFFG